jgi:hypothetical protein
MSLRNVEMHHNLQAFTIMIIIIYMVMSVVLGCFIQLVDWLQEKEKKKTNFGFLQVPM